MRFPRPGHLAMATMAGEEHRLAQSKSRGCIVRLVFYMALAVMSLGVGAALGAGLAHFDQDLVAAAWLAEQGVTLPPPYGS